VFRGIELLSPRGSWPGASAQGRREYKKERPHAEVEQPRLRREETKSEKSRRVSVKQIGKPVRRDHHRIVAALDLDRLPAGRLDPSAARFQRLVDRISTDDVGRRQAIADLIRQLERRDEGVERMRREAALYELCLRRVRNTKGGRSRRRPQTR
jgi:hypothetical protein